MGVVRAGKVDRSIMHFGVECLAKDLLTINQGSEACQLTVNQSPGSSLL